MAGGDSSDDDSVAEVNNDTESNQMSQDGAAAEGSRGVEHFTGPYANVTDFSKECLGKVNMANRLCNALPNDEDSYNYYNTYPVFNRLVSAQKDRIMNLMTRLLKYQSVKVRLDGTSIEETCDYLVDINDILLEKVASELDEAAGVKKVPDPVLVSATAPLNKPNTSWNRKIHAKEQQKTPNQRKPYRLISARNIPRPQLQFKEKITNSNEPFQPKIKEKPNAIKPLVNLSHVSNDDETEFFPHPYEWELEKFQPSSEFLELKEPQESKPLDETPLVHVETVEDLQILLQDLKEAKEIAIDLEHHSYRTYLGLTCLMQLSTREKDYIVDTLSLRGELQPLNEVFTNPKVLKVFHGATMDVQWLQRDLGLYVVGMFDTFEAAKVLHYPHLSLAYITKVMLGRTLDKEYQLADWRIRPLPDELIKYAREDTHYLLHIFDLMKKDLLEKGNNEKNLLLQTYHQSKLVCATRYEHPVCDEDSMLMFYRRSRKAFNNRQMHAFKALFQWRDTIARKEDESHAYVMPNHMMLAIAEVLPREMQGILALCNPTPSLIKQQLLTLHHIMLEAREKTLQQTVSSSGEQVSATLKVFGGLAEKDWDSPLYCPHEIADSEHRPGLPTLLDRNLSFSNTNIDSKKPIVSVYSYDELQNTKEKEKAERVSALLYWLNPHERYRLVQPLDNSQTDATDGSNNDRVNELRQHLMSLLGDEAQENDVEVREPKQEQEVSEPTDVDKLTAPIRTMLPYKTSKKKKHKEPIYYTAPDPPEFGQKRKLPRHKYPKNAAPETLGDDDEEELEPPRKSPKTSHSQQKAKENPQKNKEPKITKKRPIKDKEQVVLTGYKKKKENEEEGATSIVPHDYSKEDASKFKGGAQQAAKKLNQYAKKFFKGKPKGKQRKGGGKMMTFVASDKK